MARMKFAAKLLGTKKLVNALKQSPRDVVLHSETAIKKVVMILEAEAKREAPVDTGFLRGNIVGKVTKVTTERVEGEVGTYRSVFYAYWVHEGHMAWGHVRIPPNRFLLRAYYIQRQNVHDIFKDAIFKDFMNTLSDKAEFRYPGRA